jgi:hypothetical protein
VIYTLLILIVKFLFKNKNLKNTNYKDYLNKKLFNNFLNNYEFDSGSE